MKHLLRFCLATLSLLVAGTSFATFHTFRIDEVYSNGDGSVQFVVLREAIGANGQQFLSGHALTAGDAGGTRTFTFPNDLPGSNTSRRHVLIATQGFVALGLVTPDYVIPNGFIPTANGTVDFAGVDSLSYGALSTLGDDALYATGETKKNLATNFAGQSASVDAPTPALNYQGLWWNANESGWGINFAHQGGIIFATWFTYDAAGKPWWLIAELHRNADGSYSGPVSTVVGSPFDATPFDSTQVRETVVGSMTATFPDGQHGTIAYTVNGVSQSKAITRQSFGPVPVCVFGGLADLAAAGNFTDLWWNALEPGWGVNFSHQGDIVFATWFTYDAAGKPWWLIAELRKTGSGIYAGNVSTVAGPPFDSTPFDTTRVAETIVGTATATFANGNAATFAYTVNGATQSKAIARQVFVQPGTACR